MFASLAVTVGSVRTSAHHAKQTNTWVKPFPLDCNALDVISLKSISRSVESSLYPHLWANVCDPMMSEPEKEKKSYTLWWAAPSILSPLYIKPPFLLNWTPLSNDIPPCLELQVFHQPPPPTNKPHAPPLKNFFVVVLSRIVRLESPSQPLCWMSCNTWGSVTWDRKEWLIPPKKGDMWPSSCRLSKFN